MFVKPANLGSSIGISRATDRASLRQAMEVAYHYDSRVLVEQGGEPHGDQLLGAGHRRGLRGLPVRAAGVLAGVSHLRGKYLGGGKGPAKGAGTKGMQSQARRIPPAPHQRGADQARAKAVLRDLRGAGLQRAWCASTL